jgi:ribonuclease J
MGKREGARVTTLEFVGGVGSIGSSKFLVEQDGWRVMFDLGPAIPGHDGLLRAPVRSREGQELRDRLRTTEAPKVEHLYRADALGEGLGLVGGGDGRTALFVSHCHIDHSGLLGWVADDVPIYASPDTVAMLDALERAGDGLEGGPHHVVAMEGEMALSFGPFEVVRYDVDHDVAGASGYAVRTSDGVVAYSGDLRLHGRRPELTERFAHAVRGATAFVVEGTMLSASPALAVREERGVDRLFAQVLEETPGLVLMSLYPRNVERVEAFLAVARARGRRILWPEQMARFLTEWGLTGIESYRPDLASDVRAAPSHFVLQVATERLTDLLELGCGPGACFVHANGEPLGPFQPTWEVLQNWLGHLHVPFRSIGTSGHAFVDDLHQIVATVAPTTVYPIHTADPYHLQPPPGTTRIIPCYGKTYPVRPSFVNDVGGLAGERLSDTVSARHDGSAPLVQRP